MMKNKIIKSGILTLIITSLFLSQSEAVPWPIDKINGDDNIAGKWIGKTYLNFNLRQDDMVKKWEFREFHTGIDIVAWEGTEEVKAVSDEYILKIQRPAEKGTGGILVSDKLFDGTYPVVTWGYWHTKEFWRIVNYSKILTFILFYGII